ncbi:MAG: hypothetical protein ACLUEQ_09190 [Cloacibacillus evryensis]
MGIDGDRLEMLFLLPEGQGGASAKSFASRDRQILRQPALRQRAEHLGIRILRTHGV